VIEPPQKKAGGLMAIVHGEILTGFIEEMSVWI
jgi:hypothetical protein